MTDTRDKEAFFGLRHSDQVRIRLAVGVLAIGNGIQFLEAWPDIGTAGGLGILGNLGVLGWCAAPRAAPSLVFRLVPGLAAVVLAFDVYQIYLAGARGGVLGVGVVVGLVKVCVLPFLAGPLVRFQRALSARTSQGQIDTSD